MSGADAVRLAAAEAALRASQRHVRRLVQVLDAIALKDGDLRCFCKAWGQDPIPNHTPACLAAREELLLLPLVARP